MSALLDDTQKTVLEAVRARDSQLTTQDLVNEYGSSLTPDGVRDAVLDLVDRKLLELNENWRLHANGTQGVTTVRPSAVASDRT